jgi:hypothetical protein
LKGLPWKRVKSIHSREAFEAAISADMVLKLYLGDETAGGNDTVIITTKTDSFMHSIGVLPYELGFPVNYWNTMQYCSSNGC